MSSTLIDSVKSVFTKELIVKFSGLLNDTEGNIQKTVQAAVPIILTEVLRQAGSTAGASKVWNLSKQSAGSDFFGQLHELSVSSGGLVAGSVLLSKGADFARGLLSDRTDTVIKEISRHAGVSIASASFIAGVVSFASLDSIGRQIVSSNMDVKGLIQWLDTQRESIIHAIPAGLQVKTPLGIRLYPREKAVRTKRNTALYVVLGLIVLFVVIFILYRSNRQTDSAVSANTTDTLAAAPSQVANHSY